MNKIDETLGVMLDRLRLSPASVEQIEVERFPAAFDLRAADQGREGIHWKLTTRVESNCTPATHMSMLTMDWKLRLVSGGGWGDGITGEVDRLVRLMRLIRPGEVS